MGVPFADLHHDRGSVDDELAQLQENLVLTEWRETKVRADADEEREVVRAIEERIAELEAARNS